MAYHRPLVATDLSNASEAAATVTLRLAEETARGVILHVVAAPDVAPGARPDALIEREARLAADRQASEQLLLEWGAKLGLRAYEARMVYGQVGRTIAAQARETHADLIAIGSTGAGHVERALIGSAARSLLRHATVDTLVARGDGGPIRHILFATDFQEPSRLAAGKARELALRHGARVTLLHAIPPDLFAGALYPTPPEGRFGAAWLEEHVLGALAQTNAASFGGEAKELAIHDRPAHGIVAKAKEQAVDLIVVGSHGAGVLGRILLGSVADAVAANAPCSTLIVRARTRDHE